MTDSPSGYQLEPAGEADATRCGELCRRVLGFDRDGDFRAAVRAGSAMLAIRDGELVGYTTGIGFGGHSVALDNESLKALVAAAPSLPGPGFLVPMDNYDLLSWCLSQGSKIAMQMNLMCKGFFDRPSGAWMPSVLR